MALVNPKIENHLPMLLFEPPWMSLVYLLCLNICHTFSHMVLMCLPPPLVHRSPGSMLCLICLHSLAVCLGLWHRVCALSMVNWIETTAKWIRHGFHHPFAHWLFGEDDIYKLIIVLWCDKSYSNYIRKCSYSAMAGAASTKASHGWSQCLPLVYSSRF